MDSANALATHLSRLEATFGLTSATDAQLVERFVAQRDEQAYAGLVKRHGPMVWGVCRRTLRNHADAEDAFQATFLVLLQKADTIAPRGMVGNWLYGVAVRAALKARTNRARHEVKERQAAAMKSEQSAESGPDREWLRQVDEEISRLPEKYRVAIVLCDVDGRTREQAAQELGWPPGTVAGRLARARELLAKRLSRRGVTVSSAAIGAAVAESAAASALPPQLLALTAKFAVSAAAGQVAAALSPQLVILTKGVLKSMFVANLKSKLLIAVVVVLTAGLGAGGVAVALTTGDDATTPINKRDTTQQKPEVKKMTDKEKLQGVWNITTLEIAGNAMPREMLGGSKIEIDGDKFATTSAGATYQGAFSIDPNKSPKTLDMHFTEGPEKGNTNLAIYQLDGDDWKICIDISGKSRPTEFATKSGSNHALETLKRRAPANAKQPAKTDMEWLEGEWAMESGERDGQPFAKEMVESMKRTAIDGETTVTMAGQRYMRAQYTVDSNKKPKQIDYTLTHGPDIGKKQLGIYEIDGDRAKFCFVPAGAERPTDFTTKEGSGRTVTVWKRVKKDNSMR